MSERSLLKHNLNFQHNNSTVYSQNLNNVDRCNLEVKEQKLPLSM